MHSYLLLSLHSHRSTSEKAGGISFCLLSSSRPDSSTQSIPSPFRPATNASTPNSSISGNNLRKTKSTIAKTRCLFKYASPKTSSISPTCRRASRVSVVANSLARTISGTASTIFAAQRALIAIASCAAGGARPGPSEFWGNRFVRMTSSREGRRAGLRIDAWMWWERSLCVDRDHKLAFFLIFLFLGGALAVKFLMMGIMRIWICMCVCAWEI